MEEIIAQLKIEIKSLEENLQKETEKRLDVEEERDTALFALKSIFDISRKF